ncbi:MAG: hypothetical protein ACE5I1_25950 [bacterium]
MQALTLPELVKREGIPTDDPIFRFRRENGKGIIEFEISRTESASGPQSPLEALKRLEKLQVDLGRRTDSAKIIRAHRRGRFSRLRKNISVTRKEE